MALYLSPLVDVKEIDLTTTIPAVATSIAVTVIRDPYKGPELKTQLVGSVDELIEIFGEPVSGSYRDILSATGYLKYGNKLYTTAVFAPSATFAGVHGIVGSPITDGDLDSYTTSGAYTLSDFESEDPDEFGDESIVFDAGQEDELSNIAFIAKTRGRWGNTIKIALIGKDTYNMVRQGSMSASAMSMSQELYDDVDSVDTNFDEDDDYSEFLTLIKVADQDQINKSSPNYDLKEALLSSTNRRKMNDEARNIFCENVINQQSNYIRVSLRTEDLDMSQYFNGEYQSFGGGQNSNGDSVTDSDIIRAFELYDDPEKIDINILVDSDKSDTIKRKLIEISEDRKDCMAILDVPYEIVVNNKGQEATDLRDYRLGNHSTYNFNESSSYAAQYGTWLEVYDKWNGRYRWVPFSGHAAGIFANTDDVSEPWFAPAGLNRALISNVRKLSFNPTQGERDILYKNGFNPVVSFAGQGKVVWGQKTMLDRSSAFNRINVRRLFIILEKAIATAVKYFLFEPNDSFTRLQLNNMIDPFLRDVKSRRGVYDYYVVCDSTNNTPERIDRNELWCDIYIKPVRAAEFIVLNFIATKTGASFTEIAAGNADPI